MIVSVKNAVKQVSTDVNVSIFPSKYISGFHAIQRRKNEKITHVLNGNSAPK